MNDTKKLLRIFYIVAAAGVILSVLIALIFGGFAISTVKISNAMFIIALLLCMAGFVRTMLPFIRLKRKLRKNQMGKPVDLTEAPTLKWEYPVIAAGILFVLLSYLLVVI